MLAETNWTVQHQPFAPHANESVTLTAQTKGPPFPNRLWLHYQIVDPGDYIAREDDEFQTRWERVPMLDSGLSGDLKAGDGLLTARLPASLQKHRRLVRYQVSHDKEVAPRTDNLSEHQAYFVYDGVPDWFGAINPDSPIRPISNRKRFPSSALTRVPVYHLISKKKWIESSTWTQPSNSFRSARSNFYRYTGTMVYDGKVYDHVRFRPRGGVWRHAMGKNMWKFNFRQSQPFQAIDNFKRPYQTTWDKLNLGACIQQGQYGMRGGTWDVRCPYLSIVQFGRHTSPSNPLGSLPNH